MLTLSHKVSKKLNTDAMARIMVKITELCDSTTQ